MYIAAVNGKDVKCASISRKANSAFRNIANFIRFSLKPLFIFLFDFLSIFLSVITVISIMYFLCKICLS